MVAFALAMQWHKARLIPNSAPRAQRLYYRIGYMAKLIHKLSARIIIAAVFGFLAAATFTGIQGPCTTTVPGENAAQCVEFSKAIMHPNDLFNNTQNSLVNFAMTFAIVSVASFALLSVYSWYQNRNPELE